MCVGRCSVVGDPHIINFVNQDFWVMQQGMLTLYQHGGFRVRGKSATKWAYIKELQWGNKRFIAAKSCKKKRTIYLTKVLGQSTLKAVVRCNIQKGGRLASNGWFYDTKFTKSNTAQAGDTFSGTEYGHGFCVAKVDKEE
jgi:hypothetical protein